MYTIEEVIWNLLGVYGCYKLGLYILMKLLMQNDDVKRKAIIKIEKKLNQMKYELKQNENDGFDLHSYLDEKPDEH